ncbi:hypothetical protein [Curtobacterium flaccumfaciens]|uniref:hypothetical protein n=1 Tax=Curtobacterium flaccumfaciens TaxID=2035 RepID=UPI002204C2D4|nr:hypothetical protein [Curtobacterium flaccumfaciens]UWD79252.1 hypothetical protein NY058_00300 [Curtobacterium flaccumfaciens]
MPTDREDDRWVSDDQYVAEPGRWLLKVMDGRDVVITQGGIPFALFRPSLETLHRHDDTAQSNDREPLDRGTP